MNHNKRKTPKVKTLLEDKPGGGLTDFGARYRIGKNDAIAQARQALIAAEGDVDKAASSLDISSSALRYYLNLEPSLEKTKEKVQKDSDGEEEQKVKKESKNLVITIGDLRKVIREEIERAELEELKLPLNEPLAQGGAGFHTGPETRLPELSDLTSLYEENEIIPAEELADWFKMNDLYVVDMLPPVVIPHYKFIGEELFGLDVKGNQSVVVRKTKPGEYRVEGIKLAPSAMAARMKYSN